MHASRKRIRQENEPLSENSAMSQHCEHYSFNFWEEYYDHQYRNFQII